MKGLLLTQWHKKILLQTSVDPHCHTNLTTWRTEAEQFTEMNLRLFSPPVQTLFTCGIATFALPVCLPQWVLPSLSGSWEGGAPGCTLPPPLCSPVMGSGRRELISISCHHIGRRPEKPREAPGLVFLCLCVFVTQSLKVDMISICCSQTGSSPFQLVTKLSRYDFK